MTRQRTEQIVWAVLIGAFTILVFHMGAAGPAEAHAVRPPAKVVAKRKAIIVEEFGFARARTALCVAEAESSFDIFATDYADGTHWGLFQVSPTWRRVVPGFGWNTRQQARQAAQIVRRAGWNPWRSDPCV